MRTTITLSESVLKAAKRRAAERGVTLSTIIEEALRTELSHGETPGLPKFKLITHDHGGVRPGINLDKTSALFHEDDIARFGGRRGRG